MAVLQEDWALMGHRCCRERWGQWLGEVTPRNLLYPEVTVT